MKNCLGQVSPPWVMGPTIMAWLGDLCWVLAANGSACGERRNKARLAHWLGRGSKAYDVVWVQAIQDSTCEGVCGWRTQHLTRAWAQWACEHKALRCASEHGTGRASMGLNSVRVSYWIAWTTARLWHICVPKCAWMCSDMRHARRGWIMRKLEAFMRWLGIDNGC